MQRFLVILGAALVVVGLAWPWLAKLGLGRLPGDIHIERDGFSFHFPIVTCVIISLVLSFLVARHGSPKRMPCASGSSLPQLIVFVWRRM